MPRTRKYLPLALLVALLAPSPARAVLDVNDRGPVLKRGNFNLRVTNAGILGNAFLDVGLSNDPSFETPPGSGQEMMNYAALWVGGVTEDGRQHVSGGPLLEFRPTLDPADHVRMAEFGRLGAQRFYDDDGDGKTDEEILNGKDDDGDFEVDEDLGLFSQEIAVAEYVDDRPEAVDFVYPNGEKHVALGVSVHQEAYAWAVPGFDRAAGVTYTITNHTTKTIRDLYVGLYADLDAKLRLDRAGHLNDRIGYASYSRMFPDGVDSTTMGGVISCMGGPPCPPSRCTRVIAGSFPYLKDGAAGSTFPVVAVVGLHHTTDPLARMFGDGSNLASAPANVSFRYGVYATARLPGQGGSPRNDNDRYAALQGQFVEANTTLADDYAVLVSCGPFPKLEPGASVQFTVALVAGSNPDSLAQAAGNIAQIEDGVKFNRLGDFQGRWPHDYDRGATGINGHDTCVEAPPGIEFVYDPDCAAKFGELGPLPQLRTYRNGQCIWTDTDCSGCTGKDGWDTFYRWRDPGVEPPPPNFELVPLDHAVSVRWDNYSEVLLKAHISGNVETAFKGYHIWKLADWRERPSLVPPRPRWALVASFARDTLFGGALLSDYTDTTLDYVRILYEQKLYPMGRYHYEDADVLNGFDFLYVVSAVYEIHDRDSTGYIRISTADTPIATEFAKRTVPRAAATNRAGSVWVVPNPFRATADWDRPQTYGDELTRHVDFMGLPKSRATIKVWTLAGDFVAQIDHDGSNGNGEAAWDLVSRNGQDVASGVYLFTVESPLGMQRGRFVIIR